MPNKSKVKGVFQHPSNLEGIFLNKILKSLTETQKNNYIKMKQPIPRYLVNQILSQARYDKQRIKIILNCLQRKGLIKIKNSGVVVKK